MKKCIVTVLGKDTVGIVAKVCTYLAENQINILDISQTIIQGYFNMMVIADVSSLEKDFTVLCDEMEKLASGKKSLRRCTGCRDASGYTVAERMRTAGNRSAVCLQSAAGRN